MDYVQPERRGFRARKSALCVDDDGTTANSGAIPGLSGAVR